MRLRVIVMMFVMSLMLLSYKIGQTMMLKHIRTIPVFFDGGESGKWDCTFFAASEDKSAVLLNNCKNNIKKPIRFADL